MRRIIVLIMIFSIVFCACAKKENKGTVSDRQSVVQQRNPLFQVMQQGK